MTDQVTVGQCRREYKPQIYLKQILINNLALSKTVRFNVLKINTKGGKAVKGFTKF